MISVIYLFFKTLNSSESDNCHLAVFQKSTPHKSNSLVYLDAQPASEEENIFSRQSKTQPFAGPLFTRSSPHENMSMIFYCGNRTHTWPTGGQILDVEGAPDELRMSSG